MKRLLVIPFLVITLSACSAVRGTSNHDFFVMFFPSGNVQLTPEARVIVAQAAVTARTKKPSMIEIAVPPDAPGGASLFEARVTAIENVLSAEGADPKRFARRPLSKPETAIPGAGGRAEIRIVQREATGVRGSLTRNDDPREGRAFPTLAK